MQLSFQLQFLQEFLVAKKSAIEEAFDKIDVTNEEEFTEFDWTDFRGDWTEGEWNVILELGSPVPELNASASMKCIIEGNKVSVETTQDGKTEKQVMSIYEFTRSFSYMMKQFGLENFLENLKNMPEGYSYSGKPYFVINKDKTVIALDFSASFQGESAKAKSVLIKNVSEDKKAAEASKAPAAEETSDEDDE